MCWTYVPVYACHHSRGHKHIIFCLYKGHCRPMHQVPLRQPGYCWNCLKNAQGVTRRALFPPFGAYDEAKVTRTAQRVFSLAAPPGKRFTYFPNPSSADGSNAMVDRSDLDAFANDVRRPWGFKTPFHTVEKDLQRHLLKNGTLSAKLTHEDVLFLQIRKAAFVMDAEQAHLDSHRSRFVPDRRPFDSILQPVPVPDWPKCVICREDMGKPRATFEDGQLREGRRAAEDPAGLACGHVVGRDCMVEWLKRDMSCPYCRAVFKAEVLPDLEDDGLRPWWYHLIVSTLAEDWTPPNMTV